MSYFKALAVSATLAVAAPVQAAPVNVDIMFVIDQSGSMSNELTTLAANVATFVNGLVADANVLSVATGLVSYEDVSDGDITLHQALTTSVASLSAALNAVPTFGGTEEALHAVDAVLPGGSLFNASGWRNDTVKSVVLITDEDADNASSYTFGLLSGYAALGAKLDSVSYLNNIITEDHLFGIYEPASRPIGNPGDYKALFDLDNFTGTGADPNAFLSAFAAAKLTEITTGGTTTGGSNGVVPLPAAGWLLIGAFGALGAMKRRKQQA